VPFFVFTFTSSSSRAVHLIRVCMEAGADSNVELSFNYILSSTFAVSGFSRIYVGASGI